MAQSEPVDVRPAGATRTTTTIGQASWFGSADDLRDLALALLATAQGGDRPDAEPARVVIETCRRAGRGWAAERYDLEDGVRVATSGPFAWVMVKATSASKVNGDPMCGASVVFQPLPARDVVGAGLYVWGPDPDWVGQQRAALERHLRRRRGFPRPIRHLAAFLVSGLMLAIGFLAGAVLTDPAMRVTGLRPLRPVFALLPYIGAVAGFASATRVMRWPLVACRIGSRVPRWLSTILPLLVVGCLFTVLVVFVALLIPGGG